MAKTLEVWYTRARGTNSSSFCRRFYRPIYKQVHVVKAVHDGCSGSIYWYVLIIRIAHQDACEKCKILHRDVSTKNVMMTDDGRGILNDWELAKRCSLEAGTWAVREHERTVSTLFFLTRNPESHCRFAGHLTVHLHLKPYVSNETHRRPRRYGIFCHPRSVSCPSLYATQCAGSQNIMFRVFDDSNSYSDGYSRGGRGKRALFRNKEYVGRNFQCEDNKPMTDWINLAIDSVAQWQYYAYPPPSLSFLPPSPHIPEDQLLFRNHQLIDLWQWNKVLAMPGWPLNDAAVGYWPKTSDGSTVVVTGKHGDIRDSEHRDEGEDAPKRKIGCRSRHIHGSSVFKET